MRGLSLLLLAALVAGATADGSYFFFFGPGINWPPINRPPGLGGASGATTVTPVGPPRVGTYKVGQTSADPLACGPGYKPSGADSDITMGRQLIDNWWVKYAVPELRKQGSEYGCPYGAVYDDGAAFFGRYLGFLLGGGALMTPSVGSHHNSVSVCMQNSLTKPTMSMFAQGVINYQCLTSSGKPSGKTLHVAVYDAEGSYRSPAGGELEGSSNPKVTPEATPGTYVKGSMTPFPDLNCANFAGFKSANDVDSYIMMSRQLIDDWFVKYALPKIRSSGDNTYGCPYGAKFDGSDNAFFGPAAAHLVGTPNPSPHYSVSVCIQKTITPGAKTEMYGQGIINYYCLDRNGRKTGNTVHVGMYTIKGNYIAPSQLLGGAPPVTVIKGAGQTGSYQTGVTSIGAIEPFCKSRNMVYVVNGNTETEMTRKLIDAYFLQLALPKLRAGGSVYGCPYGAKYVDDDPFFGPKGLDDTKHVSTSACFPKSPKAGQTYTMYAQGIINYYCLNKSGGRDGPNRHVAIYSAAGTYKA